MDFTALNRKMGQPDLAAITAAQAQWDNLAKPLGSLGLLEAAIVKIAGLRQDKNVRLDRRCLLVFCADNGVVSENVTQAGSEITLLVAENIARGCSSVSRMAQLTRTDLLTVDMGMACLPHTPGLLDCRIAAGTANIAQGPAMSRVEALQAIQTGIDLAFSCREQGYDILATGEMGIGNTTTSSAIAATLLGKSVDEVTGRGAGLTDEGLTRKIAVIERALAVNRPDANDAIDVLAKLGGFDIAAMTGLYLGGALCRLPVLLDGVISATAALVACRLCPAALVAMLASHVSAEPAARLLLGALGLRPLITAELRLGEGTGAVAALPLLDLALAVYHEAATFNDTGMDNYTPQDGYTAQDAEEEIC